MTMDPVHAEKILQLEALDYFEQSPDMCFVDLRGLRDVLMVVVSGL